MILASLGAKHLHRIELSADRSRVVRHEVYFRGDPPDGLGRLREVVTGPDGALHVTTSNCDGRGTCGASRDSVVRIVK